jgi:hypothetical protein
VGGVPEQGHSRHPLPAVLDRQGVEGARDRRGVAVGDQGGELGSPAVELLDDPRRRGHGIGEIDPGEPARRLQELRVGVERPATLPVRRDPLARREREQRSAADHVRGRGVADVAVEQVGLDDRDADVLGCRVREQRPDP